MCGLSLWWLILHISLLFSDSTIWKRSGVGGVSQYFVVIFTWKWWDDFNLTNISYFSKEWFNHQPVLWAKNSSNNNSQKMDHDAQVRVLSLGLGRDNNWPFLIFSILRLCRTVLKLWDFVVWQTLDLSLTWKFVTPPKTNMSPKNGLFQ